MSSNQLFEQFFWLAMALLVVFGGLGLIGLLDFLMQLFFCWSPLHALERIIFEVKE